MLSAIEMDDSIEEEPGECSISMIEDPECDELIIKKPAVIQRMPKQDVERVMHEWAIFNFAEMFPELASGTKRNGKRIIRRERKVPQEESELELISQPFMCGQLVKRTSTWEMELRVKGGNLSVALSCAHCFHPEVEEIWTRFDADIVDFNGNVLYSEGGGSFFNSENLTPFTPRDKIGPKRDARAGPRNSFWETDIISRNKLSKNWNTFVHRNILNLRLKLHVYCQKPLNEARHLAEFHEPVKLCFTDSSIFQAVAKTNDFLIAVERLWHTMEGADVMIKIGGNILKAHKFIVAVQNPVLKKMIAAGEVFDGSHIISLPNHSFQTFQLILKYFYTQDAAEVKTSADIEFISSVLQACNDFEVKSLARICLVRLITNMKVENFGETAVAIYKNVSREQSFFKTEVKRFLMENQSILQKSVEFQKFAKAQPEYFRQLCFEPVQLIIP